MIFSILLVNFCYTYTLTNLRYIAYNSSIQEGRRLLILPSRKSVLGAKFRPPPKPWMMTFVGCVLLNLEFRRELKSRISSSEGSFCVFLKMTDKQKITARETFHRHLLRSLRQCSIEDSESIRRYYRCRRKVSLERRSLSIQDKMIVILKLKVAVLRLLPFNNSLFGMKAIDTKR